MAGDTRTDDGDAVVAGVGDDIAGDRGGFARDVDTVVAVADAGGAGAGGADPVVGDGHVVDAGCNIDTVGGEARDHQAADRAAAAADAQCQAVDTGTRGAAVDAYQRRTRVTGLRGRVDRQLLARDGGKRGRERDRLHAGTGDVEDDSVYSRIVVGREHRLAQRDASVGTARAAKRGNRGGGAVCNVTCRVDDDEIGRGGRYVGGKLRRAAIIAAAEVDGCGRADAVASVDPHIGKGGVDGPIARAVGRHRREAEITLAFTVGRIGDARPVGKELDAVSRVSVRVQRTDDPRTQRVRVRGSENWEILQSVGCGRAVRVASVVGRNAVDAKVDALLRVAKNRIAEDVVTNPRAGFHPNAIAAVKGDHIALARVDTTDGEVGRTAENVDTCAHVTERRRASGRGADVVALNNCPTRVVVEADSVERAVRTA